MPDVITNNLDVWTECLSKSDGSRGSNGKEEARAIKILRKLILELAVRGKLVAQDPKDEPAHVLLEDIATTRQQLVDEGNIRQHEPLRGIAEQDRPYELPLGWEWDRLGNLFDVQDAQRRPINRSERASRNGPYPYYGANGQVGFIDAYLFEGERILVAEDGGFFDDPIRGVAYVVDGQFWVNNHAHVLKCLCGTNARYWAAYLNRLDWAPLVRGMTRDKLNQSVMNDIVMAVPPRAEQDRIVAKVDELMALCDQLQEQQARSIEAHQALVETLLGRLTRVTSQQTFLEAWNRVASHCDLLFTTEYSIDQLRLTVLKLAVIGKLVAQDPRDESASVLLKRIADQRAKLSIAGAIKKPRQLPAIDRREMPTELPPGWEWARFGDIAQHNSGKTLDRGRNTGQLRDYITTSNLRWGRFDLADVRQMPIGDDELEKCTARKGDLLICEGGEAGRAAVWPFDRDICFQNHVHRARLYGEIDPYFAYRYFEKLSVTGELEQHRKGVGIPNLSSRALALIVVPIPPLAEQRRIVAKIDELMTLCSALRTRLADAQATQSHLADAIVEQAVA